MGNQEIKGSLGQGQGYRIISVSENSPCSIAGIKFFTDFIVDVIPVNQNPNGANNNGQEQEEFELELNEDGQYVVDEKKDFFTLVSENENKPLKLVIYDILQRKIRTVQITPNKAWSNQQNLLGVMLRLENYLTSHDNTFKILTVDENSPAHQAGLQAKQDYVIGLKKYKYDGLDELINIIFDNEGQEIELIVYNTQDKLVKSVMLKPQMNWGGRGLIGCEFGGGYLNQLPVVLDEAAELAKLEEEKKRIDQLNKLIHKDEIPQPRQQLSNEPPPTHFDAESGEHNYQAKVVAHQHHYISQHRTRKNSHHEHQEAVAHNTNPFAVPVPRKTSSHNDEQYNDAQPQEQRKQSTSLGGQENLNNLEAIQETRKSSKSLTNQGQYINNSDNNIEQVAPPTVQIQNNGLPQSNPYLQNDNSRLKSLSQQSANLQNSSEQLSQSRKDSLNNKKYEFECATLQSKYIIMERDLFNLRVKLQPQPYAI